MRDFASVRSGSRGLSPRGFSLIELLVVIAVIALLVSILLPSLCTARASGRKSQCVSNLKQFGVGIQGYSTDFYDRLVSFTWRKGVQYTDWVGAAGDVNLACANQAIDIIRRRTSRTDIITPTNWIPFPLYNHIVMNDYLGQSLPERMVACPEDRLRQLWQRSVVPDPLAFHALPADVLRPGTAGVQNDDKRWPYSSSYQFVTAFWAPDYDRTGARTVHQGPQHNTYYVPTAADKTVLGERRMTDVNMPSQKVAMFDSHDRHPSCGNRLQLFNCYTEASQPVLYFDTSVRDLPTKKANRGFNPEFPLNQTMVTTFTYTPAGWEPPRKPGAAFTMTGYYRWTRGGLKGVDSGGTEIPVINTNN
jgi:prepilin-type N-terminal cleavage/methylation domain-containing protein